MTTDCIDHNKQRSVTPEGYAKVVRSGIQTRLHRAVFCVANGIPLESIKGLMVLHSCDNPRCINPAHLRLGTHAENMDDVARRRRAHGVKLTPAQISDIRKGYQPAPATGRGNSNPNGLKGLSRKYGVSHSSIRAVVQRTTFKHLP